MNFTPNSTDESDFKRYTPQHPLPEELKKLARDDTVCKYCGVSYLIHNEIKALEDKLKEAEKELVLLRGQKERELALRRENEALHMQMKELQITLQSNADLISSLSNESENLKVECKLSQESSHRYKNKFMETLRKFSKLSQVIRQQKDTLNHTRHQLDQLKQEMTSSFVTVLENVSVIKVTSIKERETFDSQLQCIDMEKMVLTQSNKSLSDQLKAKEEELIQSRRQLELSQNSKSELEQHMLDSMAIGKELENTKNSLKVMEENWQESKSVCNTLTAELEQYKLQLRKKTSENVDLANQQKQLKEEYDVSSQKQSLELHSKEEELKTCLRSLKDLENKFKEHQQKESQITQERNSSINKLQELKESLERARADREALKSERELLIQAHQNRIEDLRDSFKKKMADMDNWPQKLQAAVSAERNRLLGEMKTLEDDLKHNFVLELQIEKDKYNELLKKFQAQEKDKENLRDNKLNQIEQKYKQEIADLNHQLADSKRKAREREEELSAEIANLKRIINDLQDRFAKLEGEDEGKVTKLQSDLSSAQQELSNCQDQVKLLEEKLRQSKEKGEFLQGVVQRECEERFELTEALSEARKELLSLKMPAGGYNQKRGSISSQQSFNQSDDALLKARIQMQTNNVNLSYSKNNNSNSSSRNSSGEISSRQSKDSTIMETRKRIANMLGRK